MEVRIRLQTHEVIIHSQIASIEAALERPVVFDITLNQKQAKSTIEFTVSEKEMATLKHNLGLNIFVLSNGQWIQQM